MSIFIHSSCQVIGDTAVNHLSWSHTQQIVVLSTYSIDDQDKETNKVLFANSDVSNSCFEMSNKLFFRENLFLSKILRVSLRLLSLIGILLISFLLLVGQTVGFLISLSS